jgi:hypothetical protein
MVNRRHFLKNLIGSIFLMNADPLSLFAGNNELKSHEANVIETPHIEIPRDRRIFCQVENSSLEKEIEQCADFIGCEVIYGEPFSPDLLVTGAFIFVLDRNYVGQDWWDAYVSFCNEFKWNEPCLIVDAINNMVLPNSNYVARFYPGNPTSIASLLNVIKEVMANNTPMDFKKISWQNT